MLFILYPVEGDVFRNCPSQLASMYLGILNGFLIFVFYMVHIWVLNGVLALFWLKKNR